MNQKTESRISSKLLETLSADILRNTLAGKGVIRAGQNFSCRLIL